MVFRRLCYKAAHDKVISSEEWDGQGREGGKTKIVYFSFKLRPAIGVRKTGRG